MTSWTGCTVVEDGGTADSAGDSTKDYAGNYTRNHNAGREGIHVREAHCMGRTVPTFTMVIQQEMKVGKIPARVAQEDQEALDELFRAARLQLAGSAYAARRSPLKASPCACSWRSTG